MGMLLASSFHARLTVDAPHPVKVRRRRHGRIGSRAPRQWNADRSISPPDVANEWDIVQHAIAGNADAQEPLFARHAGRLYRTAFAVLRDKEDAEDALQDGFYNAYSRLGSFQGRSSFSSWLTRIVINAALMIRRKKNAHPEASLDEMLDSQPERFPDGAIDPRPGPERIYAAKQIHTLVQGHVRRLTPALQAAYQLRVIKDLSAEESSQVLGIPVNAFKSRIFHARRKLGTAMGQSVEKNPPRTYKPRASPRVRFDELRVSSEKGRNSAWEV